VAFFSSLLLLFGESEAWRIRKHFDTGGGDIEAHMLPEAFAALHAREQTVTALKSNDPDLERKKRNLKRLAAQRRNQQIQGRVVAARQ